MYWNDAFIQLLPWFKPNRLRAWEQTNSAFPTSFSQFHPRLSHPPHANEKCQSQDALLAAGSTASVGQVRSRLLPISLTGNQECPPPPPPPPPPPTPPLLPPPPLPNSSYQTHQEICDRTILRSWVDCHQLPQRWRIMCANALHLCALYLCMPECCFYMSWM